MKKLGPSYSRSPSPNLHPLLPLMYFALCPPRGSAPVPPRNILSGTTDSRDSEQATLQREAIALEEKLVLLSWEHHELGREDPQKGLQAPPMSPMAGCWTASGQHQAGAAAFQSRRPGQATNMWTQPLHNLLKSHTVFPGQWPQAKTHTFQFLRL